MPYKIISFDLQGTLTDAAFSDEFWLEYLPRTYSQKHRLTVEEGKKQLGALFHQYGKYDYRYYSVKYWLQELKITESFSEIVRDFKHQPYFYPEMAKLVQELSSKIPLIIISTTTYDFIDIELVSERKYFQHIYSTLDDLHLAGKSSEVFLAIAQSLQVTPSEILHIGNNKEMDISNAQKAGVQVYWFDETTPLAFQVKNIYYLMQ